MNRENALNLKRDLEALIKNYYQTTNEHVCMYVVTCNVEAKEGARFALITCTNNSEAELTAAYEMQLQLANAVMAQLEKSMENKNDYYK